MKKYRVTKTVNSKTLFYNSDFNCFVVSGGSIFAGRKNALYYAERAKKYACNTEAEQKTVTIAER